MQGEGGTPLFPDLGKHCTLKWCNVLDFLPFKCDFCNQIFCAEHGPCSQHDCPQANGKDRLVVVCPACSVALMKPSNGDSSVALQKHADSGQCDPGRRSRDRPACPANRCKQILTFSNTYVCKLCRRKTCLKHRFPSDHGCGSNAVEERRAASAGTKFLSGLAKRQATHCANGHATDASSAQVGKPAGCPVLEAR